MEILQIMKRKPEMMFKYPIEQHYTKLISNFSEKEMKDIYENVSTLTEDMLSLDLDGFSISAIPYILSNKVRKNTPCYALASIFNMKIDHLFKYVSPEYAETTLKNEELFFQNPINWGLQDKSDCNMLIFRKDEVINEVIDFGESDNELLKYVKEQHDSLKSQLIDKLDELRSNALVTCLSSVKPTSCKSEELWKKFACDDAQKEISWEKRIPNGICIKIKTSGLPNTAYMVTYAKLDITRIGKMIRNQIFDYRVKGGSHMLYEVGAECLISIFKKDLSLSNEMEWRCVLEDGGIPGCHGLVKNSMVEVYHSRNISDELYQNLKEICSNRGIHLRTGMF